MPKCSVGPPHFIVPAWMTTPLAEDTVRSGITIAAINRIFQRVRGFKLDADFTWTVSGIYENTGTAHLEDEIVGTLGGDPTDERDAQITNWKGFGWGAVDGATNPMPGRYTFLDGATNPSTTLTSGYCGIGFQWTAPNPQRSNTWAEAELELAGFVSCTTPEDAYELNELGESQPVDIGITSRSFTVAIAWEKGKPGEPFFGRASIHEVWEDGDFAYTFIAVVTITPTEHWTYDGELDAETGEPVPPEP